MKTYRNPSIVSGKSVTDILNMNIETFNKLSKSDLQKVVGRLVSAGNKRLRNFEKRGLSSSATRAVEKSGGKFSTRGKNINELRSEFARARNFLTNKSSTIKGHKQVQKKTIEALNKAGVNVTPENLDKVLKAYEELKELNPYVGTQAIKYRVMAEITQKGKVDFEELILEMQEELDELYEEEIETLGGDGGVSDFFEL